MLLTGSGGMSLDQPVPGAANVSIRVADSDEPQEISLDCPVELVEAAAKEVPKPNSR
jgi:hypothetical protein